VTGVLREPPEAPEALRPPDAAGARAPVGPAAAARPWTAVGPRDAPVIVFLHGTRLTRRQWWPQLRRLSDRYRCVAVDLPGHGVLAAEPFSIAAATALVRDAIDAEAADGRASVVGLSLGGYVAVDAAEALPGRVTCLVLAGCSAEPVGPATVPFRTFAVVLERVPPRLLRLLNLAFFRARYRRPIAEPIIEGGFWSEGGARALRAVLGRRYLERLARLWTPVTVVNGAFDPVFGPGGDPWASAARRGRHVVVPGALHLSNLDRPRTFAGIVAAAVEDALAHPPAPA
jgi:pimeloyl-ACP methyl ester carboxylesterase